ncbi:MAG: SDR family NAD(P)-dependent oxidoreductase [Gammaproteobacteria bacterium]
MKLENQVILITGAAGGLGSTASAALAKEGATVILLDKTIPGLEKVYDDIVAAGGPTPAIYPFDLAGANEDQYLELARTVDHKYGKLNGLLHSAAEFGAFSPIETHSTASWGHSLNVNLNAPFLLTRVLLPVLRKSDRACVVFTSDSSVAVAKAYAGAYGVSKIALQALAKILAEELESSGRIRVNTLIPGPVDSPLRKKAYPGEDKSLLPRMQSLSEVYTFLFSAESLGVNGETVAAELFLKQHSNP